MVNEDNLSLDLAGGAEVSANYNDEEILEMGL